MQLIIQTLCYRGSKDLKPFHPLSVHNLSFAEHTSTALIGGNGAGKSTLLGALLGFRLDFHIEASLNGVGYANTTPPQRAKLGYKRALFKFPSRA